jgi:hypothetical protein
MISGPDWRSFRNDALIAFGSGSASEDVTVEEAGGGADRCSAPCSRSSADAGPEGTISVRLTSGLSGGGVGLFSLGFSFMAALTENSTLGGTTWDE